MRVVCKMYALYLFLGLETAGGRLEDEVSSACRTFFEDESSSSSSSMLLDIFLRCRPLDTWCPPLDTWCPPLDTLDSLTDLFKKSTEKILGRKLLLPPPVWLSRIPLRDSWLYICEYTELKRVSRDLPTIAAHDGGDLGYYTSRGEGVWCACGCVGVLCWYWCYQRWYQYESLIPSVLNTLITHITGTNRSYLGRT